MNDFESFMGFSVKDMETAEKSSQNLTPGTYKMMIDSVRYMSRPKQGEAYAVDNPAQAGSDLCIEIECILAEASGEFPINWKHTIFLRPADSRDNIAGLNRAYLNKIFKATNVQPSSDMANALVGKMFILELKAGKDPKYTNIKDILPIGGTPTAATPATAPAAAPAKKAAPKPAADAGVPGWANNKPAAATTAAASTDSDWE